MATLLLASPVQAQKRVALVIGNSAYQHAGTLANPRNDAADVGAALKLLGLKVIEGFDLDKESFNRKIRDFADALQGMDAGVFFFAGHGLQVGGQNYLVPTDAALKDASALDFEMVRVEVIQRAMETQTETNLLFLDACRDNPLSRNLARAMGTRSTSIGIGLAPITSGVGTLISFSTQPGNVALDGTGRNSPFASALLKQLASPKEDLGAILIDVRNDVMKETNSKQVPWEHSALRGRFYFGAPPAASIASAPFGANYSAAADAARLCREIEGLTSPSLLAALASQHKDTPAGLCVTARVDELTKLAARPLPQPFAPPQAPVAARNKLPTEKFAPVTPPASLLAVVPTVVGAPGDGGTTLASALKLHLGNLGVGLSEIPSAQTYRVEGTVRLGQAKGGKQTVAIEWIVKDPTGRKLGTVSQKNEISAGSLNGPWGKAADQAASAAATGLMKLLAR